MRRLAKCTAGGYLVLDEQLPAPTIKPISPHGGAPRFDDLIWLETDALPGTLVDRDAVGHVPYGESMIASCPCANGKHDECRGCPCQHRDADGNRPTESPTADPQDC